MFGHKAPNDKCSRFTIGRIDAGEPGVAIGHLMGLLALYGLSATLLTGAVP